ALVLLVVGCKRYPEVQSPEGLRLIKALYTACSSQSKERLAKVARAVSQAREQGKVSAAEADALDAIITQAEAGDWRGAADASWAFAQDQVR
ncbi:MAG TPA: hypothetical protein PKD86_18630, partial [Gemmatales bacterium]|nr:hypothetical protein [Gemmatales bacterium]